MLPEPYYQDALVTLYHGDCRALLPLLALPERTVVVTDPPYGIAYTPRKGDNASADCRDRSRAAWSGETLGWDERDGFDVAAQLAERLPVACFSKPGLPEPFRPRARLAWEKGATGMGDLGVPWGPSWEIIYVTGNGWQGRREVSTIRDGSMQARGEALRVHPTQKPVSLLEYLIRKCPGHDVLDPFAGSGSTGVAAKRLGRRCILIEQDAHYCEVAAKWLAKVHTQEALFPEAG